MKKHAWKGDLTGGLTATLAALPVELVYGLFAVAPLGAAFANHGLRAALWACILGGVLGYLFRMTGGLITGSRPATALILGTLAAALLQQSSIQALPDPAGMVFLLVLLCTALAGVFQLIFGLCKLGRAIKYVPYPVISGLMCGVGMLMLLSALRPGMGMSYDTPWRELPEAWHPLSLLVTIATLMLCFKASRWSKRVPGMVFALLGGTLLHHSLLRLAGLDHLGGTAGHIEGLLPSFSLWQSAIAGEGGNLLRWLPELAPYALAIAGFSALETLLCLSAIESARHERLDGDRELRTQGLINTLTGILGGSSSAGNLSRVMVNISAGGHRVLSALAYASGLAVLVIFFGHWINWVPSAVTAGILIFHALGMVDEGTRRLGKQLLTQRAELAPAEYRLLVSNFCVILLVAFVAFFGDMMKAVGVGIAAAMFLFVRSSMKPVIRRVSTAQFCRSLKVRSHEAMAFLETAAAGISMIEIEGALFFGTADRVSSEIDAVGSRANAIILDLKRVSDVDASGARSLLLAARKMHSQGKTLLLCGTAPRVERFLRTFGLGAVLAENHWHHDLDTALEMLEELLLAASDEQHSPLAVHLSRTDIAKGLTESQITTLEFFLTRHQFDEPGLVFRHGDKGESLFVATSSAVDILLPLKNGHQKRVASFSPGVVFGEMALLERKPRSADALLLAPSVVWELSRKNLERIEVQHPEIAQRILLNLGCSLAERLRVTTAELRLAAEA